MYVYGTRQRIFINATLGCRSRCSYCYLPALGYKVNASEFAVVDSVDLINKVESHPEFIPGRQGTVISLGCYSECWDKSVRKITIKLIEHFLKSMNPVQFSTKCYVSGRDLRKLVPFISWRGQLCVFISTATISKWSKIERGTDSPTTRFMSFKEAREFDVPIYLYIKPVLGAITINDLGYYLDAISEHPITGVVVGKKFIKSDNLCDNHLAPIGNGDLMYCDDGNECSQLLKTFSKYITTYEESVKAVEFWRNHAQ